MTAPAIPYVPAEWSEIRLKFLDSVWNGASIKTFGILVALGVYIGSVVAVRHSKQRGLDQDKMNSFIFYVVGIGFIGGHVFDAIFYTPHKITEDPLYIFKIWAGLSSFGGFLGAIIGAILFKTIKKEKILPFVDTVCSAFPLAWVFGRMGCASVHDHPGACSDLFIAVKFPANVPPGVEACAPGFGRFDLGFVEMVLTIPLAITFWYLWRSRPRQYGFFAGWMCVAYAPVRFLLDFLRIQPTAAHEADPRYGGLTPAQWASFALIGLGFAIIRMGRQFPPVPATYAEMQENARREMLEREGEADEDDDADGEVARKAPKVKGAKPSTKTKPAKKKAVDEIDEVDEPAATDDDASPVRVSKTDEDGEVARDEPAATDEDGPAAERSAVADDAPRPRKKKKGAKARKETPPTDD